MIATATHPSAAASVAVALSGGVDSAVALLQLVRSGATVEALFMKNWEEDDDAANGCAAARDLADAEAICERLGVPLHPVNFSAEYWDRVFERFLAELGDGLTPNPDILCNREVKFREFLAYALERGADTVATGHYARRDHRDGRWRLLRGRDPDKDQSYFLYTLGQHQLARVDFPIGHLLKPEVRAEARSAGLPVSDKRDSTGICFIGERRFAEFVARYLPARSGEIVDHRGRVIGEHRGSHLYTIGQRHGLGLGGRRGGDGQPWYVAAKDPRRNRLVAVRGHDHWLLTRGEVMVSELSWVAGAAPALPARLDARIRYRQADQRCTVSAAGAGRLRVSFETPQWAPAPGQSLVLYAGDACLGGGVIEPFAQ